MTHFNIVLNDLLFRNVSSKPQLWKNSEDRPTSALFKDSKGVSVDRLKERNNEEAIGDIRTKFSDTYAIITVSTENCTKAGAVVFDKPIENNIFHAEIHKSLSEVELTSSQARQLAKVAEIVYRINYKK